MLSDDKSVLLVSMPFAETSIPSIQLALLESYLKERDIDIATKHLYLKTAEFYGLHNYNFLINSPNDPYVAQMVFSKYLFPKHWNENIEKFRYYYNNIICDDEFVNKFPFEKYIEKSDNFLTWTLENIDLKPYDIIGFTINYGQFLPSLALSKKIKENFPEKTILFGGSSTINELGMRMLKTFNWIDLIISGEGEEPLFLLISNYENYQTIPGLIYKNNEKIIWNRNDEYIDLNILPFPDFQSYFKELNICSNDIKQYYSLYGRIPIELSRGCWWNNCTFCNVRAYNKKYREKRIERFVKELDFLSEKYKNLTFQVISNTLPQHDFRVLCEKIIELRKDFDLLVEARAGCLNNEDYTLLKNAGFRHIQTGIEAFSANYLKKMNKGVKIIDNLAALKFCKENHIMNHYNMIVDYPNEELHDFEETKNNIQLIMQYIDPPQISKFLVGFGSPIYLYPEQFNIEKLDYKIIDTIMYPSEILKNNFLFFYHFKRKNEIRENNWKQLVQDWKKELEQREMQGLKSKKTIDQLVFYFIDGGTFLKIFDNRNHENVLIYVLNQIEREILLSCENVISYGELQEKLSHIPENELVNMLKIFEETGIIFQEDNHYLSLPINYSKYFSTNKETKLDSRCFKIEEKKAY